MKREKYQCFFPLLIIFCALFASANFVTNSVTVDNLEISYSTDYPENIMKVRRAYLRIEVEIKFPSGSSSIELFVFAFGLKITNIPPTIKTADNNVYGVNKSALRYEGEKGRFSFDVQVDLDSVSLEDGEVYFTPFLEYRGSYNGTTIDMTYTYLPSFSPGEEYQNTNSGSETSWFKYFIIGGGIMVISGAAIYLRKSQKKSQED